MGKVIANTGIPVEIDLREDVRDNGWYIEGNKAVHSGCNQGLIKRLDIPTVSGTSYTLVYQVEDYKSGLVRPIVGGVSGENRTSNGYFVETIETIDDSGIYFYSDGNLAISVLKVANGFNEGKTISYNDNRRFWVGYESFVPEYMNKFIDSFITFKNGEFWIHNTNEIRNMYYGQKYPSVIVFNANVAFDQEKDFYTFYIDGNKPWSIDVTIPPTEGKTNGQKSRIKKGNFKWYKGKYVADFLRDMNDARFDTELQALMKGAYLQGKVMKVTMTVDSDDHVELVSVSIDVSVK